MIRIAVADDHALFRKGLCDFLNENPGMAVVAEAANGLELLQSLDDQQSLPDVCILDIDMPGMNGYEVMERLNSLHPGLKVLALSMYEHEYCLVAMFRRGARGYVSKGGSPSDILAAVHAVHGDGYYYPELAAAKFLINRHGEYDLTETELHLLQLCCSDIKYDDIALQMHLSSRTIEYHRSKLFEKLCVNSRSGLVLFAMQTGLVSVNSSTVL